MSLLTEEQMKRTWCPYAKKEITGHDKCRVGKCSQWTPMGTNEADEPVGFCGRNVGLAMKLFAKTVDIWQGGLR